MRFSAEVTTVLIVLAGGAFAPGTHAAGVLYAPTNPDNAAFRAALHAWLGVPVDYFDARTGTPTLSQLQQYDCVTTWVNYPYGDPVAMGDRLADYVDLGGQVILGSWCYPHGQNNYLQGRIMTAAYCPAVIAGGGGDYNHDGTDCVHWGVSSYTTYEAVVALQPGAESDGTVGSLGRSGVAWRGDRMVYYGCAIAPDYSVGCVQLMVNMVALCGSPLFGACCDLQTGVCVDTSPAACEDTFYGQICAALDPPCGNPGACCDHDTGVCVDDVPQYACAYRPFGGTLCADLMPLCGEIVSVLYAPTNPDNPTFRSELAALVGGPVDYLDVRQLTPTLSQLLEYDVVFTWANYAYADKMGFGNVLADYVDAGGKVILGQWAYSGFSTGGEFWGRILDWAYCPVDAPYWTSGSYAGDGDDCVHAGVDTYSSSYVDITTLRLGAQSDGTFGSGRPAVIWRPDRKVYYSPGNTGGLFGTGDWVRLTFNMCMCQAPHIAGDLNCDGVVNAFDIDPFVLALTSAPGFAAYRAAYPDCDATLADINCDGAVNAFDIDPFVQCLTGGGCPTCP